MTMQETVSLQSLVPDTGSDLRHLAPTGSKNNQTIRDCVECAMRNYFHHLDGHDATNLYEMVLAEMEAPLLQVVLEHTRGNQSRAAEILGLNRGTLRKKMKDYGML